MNKCCSCCFPGTEIRGATRTSAHVQLNVALGARRWSCHLLFQMQWTQQLFLAFRPSLCGLASADCGHGRFPVEVLQKRSSGQLLFPSRNALDCVAVEGKAISWAHDWRDFFLVWQRVQCQSTQVNKKVGHFPRRVTCPVKIFSECWLMPWPLWGWLIELGFAPDHMTWIIDGPSW